MLASLAHLGTKKNVWWALSNLRRSWLSREILFTGLFGAGWLFTILESAIWRRSTIEWMGLTAALGLGLVYSMSRVYRLPAIPAWNTWRTNAVFMVSTLLLGQSIMAVLLSYELNTNDTQVVSIQWLIVGVGILILLLIQLLLMHKQFSRYPFHQIRIGLILAGMALTMMSIFLSGVLHIWISALVFLIVVTEETIGKWSFYQAAHSSFSSR